MYFDTCKLPFWTNFNDKICAPEIKLSASLHEDVVAPSTTGGKGKTKTNKVLYVDTLVVVSVPFIRVVPKASVVVYNFSKCVLDDDGGRFLKHF